MQIRLFSIDRRAGSEEVLLFNNKHCLKVNKKKEKSDKNLQRVSSVLISSSKKGIQTSQSSSFFVYKLLNRV